MKGGGSVGNRVLLQLCDVVNVYCKFNWYVNGFDRYKITSKCFLRLSIKRDCDYLCTSVFERSYTVLLSGVEYFLHSGPLRAGFFTDALK